MEKIKTPLMQLIEEIDTLRDDVVDLESIDIFNAYTDLRQMAVKLLPTERDMMIDFAQSYKSHCFQSIEFPDSARTMFNQIFHKHE